MGKGDVGGQKALRTYWRNYFEKTDTLIWVVDATDRERIGDCRDELKALLQEEVSSPPPPEHDDTFTAAAVYLDQGLWLTRRAMNP